MAQRYARAVGFVLILLTATVILAQTPQSAEIPTAPLPTQFVNAKRVFIANAAGDNDPAITKYTLTADGLYNQFYGDIKALGRYELVASPSDSEIVLELKVDYEPRFIVPKFRVEVRDPKTNVLLWSFTEPVSGAFLAKTGRKNIAAALAKLTDDMKKLVGTP